MNKKWLWLSWYSLLLICVIFGFLPEPQGFWKWLCVGLSVGAFVPPGLLLKDAYDRQDRATVALVRNISICSLGLTVVLYGLNVLSVLMTEAWGTVLYILLVIGSVPMICAQYWVLSLFGWSCLLWTAVTILRRE